MLTSDINKKIAFFCSEWRESGQCGASALALTTSPITLALENCSIRKPIQPVVGRENQGKNTLNVNCMNQEKANQKQGKGVWVLKKVCITIKFYTITALGAHVGTYFSGTITYNPFTVHRSLNTFLL